ncbi:MAG TPA: addiction module protein [Niastella sp.]
MSANIDKEQLIEAIRETDDERILFAISRLLQVDEDIPDWHKDILNERKSKIENGEEKFYDWNDIKDDLKNFD